MGVWWIASVYLSFLDCLDVYRPARCHLIDGQAHAWLGLALTVAIIVSDVVINSWVGLKYGIDIASFLAQLLFLAFVMLTARIAWRAELGACLPSQPEVTH